MSTLRVGDVVIIHNPSARNRGHRARVSRIDEPSAAVELLEGPDRGRTQSLRLSDLTLADQVRIPDGWRVPDPPPPVDIPRYL